MAMEDALVLAEVLAVTSDWSEVGEAFERARRARVDHVQTATDKMSRLAGLAWLRDLGAPVLGPRAFRAAYGPHRVDPFPIR
jgi:2-polyprenyl-6-methoxyphenol hydroxylase-like FAD-dependent oxidoreductase